MLAKILTLRICVGTLITDNWDVQWTPVKDSEGLHSFSFCQSSDYKTLGNNLSLVSEFNSDAIRYLHGILFVESLQDFCNLKLPFSFFIVEPMNGVELMRSTVCDSCGLLADNTHLSIVGKRIVELIETN